MKCIGQAVSEHKEVHAIRKGKRKVIIFDDVDISVQIEKVVDGQHRPMPYVVRKANEKSVKEITDEIQAARAVHREGNSLLPICCLGTSSQHSRLAFAKCLF